MKSWFEKRNFLAEMNGHMEAVLNKAIDGEDDGEVEAFLENMALLEGLPLSYLVADDKMLPQESLRLFWLDETWIMSYQNGALSLGRNNQSDRVHDRIMLAKAISDSASVRSCKGNRTGFLLRSKLVTGWPGMEFECRDPEGLPLKILKLEVVTDGIMLGIVEGNLSEIIFKEPAEALHYGMEEEQDSPCVSLVSMKSGKEGEDIQKYQDMLYRDKEEGVVDVSGLAAAMEQALHKADALDGSLSSSGFAAELLYKRQTIEWDFTGKEKL